MSESTARARFDRWLMTIFSGLALFLAAVGIYGLMAHAVQQRSREIGIRLALGAEPRSLGAMVFAQGVRLTLVGIIIGLMGAWNLTHLLAGFLFGVTSRDAVVFIAAPILLAVVAVLAVAVPAIRATRVNPIVALRCE